MISGVTSNKLDQVRTYDNTNPFQIGINGVTNVTYSPTNLTAVTSVSYSIDSINYITSSRSQNSDIFSIETIGPKPNFQIVNPRYPITTFFTNSSGYDFEPYIIFPNKQNTFDIKEEAKMGLVFPPKVSNELFIERMNLAVFEKYSRLSEIKNLGTLTYYRNGYYNIKQTT